MGERTRKVDTYFNSFVSNCNFIYSRDVSAINAARKIAGNLGLNLGQEVGYSTNFELEYNDYSTRIKVVTDEVLMKEIMIDPLLSKYEVVILTKREL